MLEGTQVGRFRIQDELGHGGMGTVYRAEDPVIGRRVAIKVIRLDDTGTPEMQRQLAQSFLREIHTAGVLQHPGIVSIFDAGKQENMAYIVMELVSGVTLESMLSAEPRPLQATLLGVCRQAASALDYAHAQGVLHRDIKPSNILIQPNGVVKIVDFGIAKIAQATTMLLSQTGTTVGTPDYMSPEQVMGKPLDGRTDQWSLAVVAYMALTGAKPFPGEQFTAVMTKIMTVDPQPPSELNPALGQPVNAVIARALDKDPAKRFTTCSEFMTALESACAVKPAPQAARKQPKPPTVETIAMVPPPPPRKSAMWPIAGVIVLLAVAAGGAFVVLRSRRPAEPVAPPVAAAPVVPAPKKPASRARTRIAEAGRPAAVPGAASEDSKPPAKAATHAVQLVTTPPDAEVTVDGKADSACHSPCAVDLAAGAHSIRVVKDGYTPVVRNFDVERDTDMVPFTLEQATGSLHIKTVPEGATISADGTVLASTTPTTVKLPMGRHVITLTKDGFAPYSFEASIDDSLLHVTSVTLAPAH